MLKDQEGTEQLGRCEQVVNVIDTEKNVIKIDLKDESNNHGFIDHADDLKFICYPLELSSSVGTLEFKWNLKINSFSAIEQVSAYYLAQNGKDPIRIQDDVLIVDSDIISQNQQF